jgi:hypothetical protein
VDSVHETLEVQMMVSMRRLRAVLLLAIVSAIGWGIVGTIIVLGVELAYGIPIRFPAILEPSGFFAAFGLVAGALYAVAIAMVPKRDGQTGLSAVRAGLAGLVGGLAVYFGFFGIEAAMMGESMGGMALMVGGVFGLVGAGTGVAIQRVAQRGALPASTDAPDSLKP